VYFALIMLPLRALGRSERRFRAVVESATDAILVLDARGQIFSTNESGATIFGVQASRLTGMQLAQFIAPGSRERFEVAWADARRPSQGGPVQLVGVRGDGTEFPIELSLSVWYAGQVSYRSAIIRDVTERRRAEEALREREEQLRQSQRLEAIGQLAAGVAHDFNNLLSVMLGRAEMALARLDSEHPARRDIVTLASTAERAANLTRQLLAFGRKQVLQPRVLDLNDVVRGMTSLLRRLIGEHVRLATLAGEALHPVKADPGQLEQVVMNLVVNARDAMPRGGTVTITTGNAELDARYAADHPEVVPGPYAMIAVTDTGHGMDAATRSRIFEPFFTTKELGKGTGLGLATVYGIVRQSGGHVWVYSEPGMGTTFKVYLPRFDAPPETAPPPPPAAPRGHAELVLLVEDDAEVRAVAHDILERGGYRLLEAASPAEALAVAGAHPEPIDLLLTDIVMPGMSGRELADRLCAARPGLRVLYMSGYTDDAVVRHGIGAGTREFLQKPFTTDGLAGKVHEVLMG
jgi:PAS domain S-box-containing protein